MPITDSSLRITSQTLADLRKEFEDHTRAIARIQQAYNTLGLPLPDVTPDSVEPLVPMIQAVRTTHPAPGRVIHRRSAKFGMTGQEAIIKFLRTGRSSIGEINKFWHKTGRGGDAYTTIGLMVKQGIINRHTAIGKNNRRTYEYTLAGSVA